MKEYYAFVLFSLDKKIFQNKVKSMNNFTPNIESLLQGY